MQVLPCLPRITGSWRAHTAVNQSQNNLVKINQYGKLVVVKTDSIQTIGAFEAKTHLSGILEKVRRGARFVITKNGEEVAELKPVTKSKRFVLGCDLGKVVIHSDFNDPLPEFLEHS